MTKFSKYFIDLYSRKNINIVRSEGSYLYSGNERYLDMISGLGVNVLGGSNHKVIQAVNQQLRKFMHVSNYYETEPVGKLAECLVKNSFAEKVFFCNSGTEAIEAGLKLIKKYGSLNNKNKIVTFSKGFHGRSLGSISVTEPDKIKPVIEPLIPGIESIEFNNIKAVEQNINENTAGVILELVQGQGGVNIADKDFAYAVRNTCDRYNTVLLIDEIQSGMGRTGQLFSYEKYGIEPDISAIAKAVGGGLPLGALLVNEKYSSTLGRGEHGSTFGGNPVACAAGLATLKQVNDPDFLNSVSEKGKYLLDNLKKLELKYSESIINSHGIGLMIGIEVLISTEHLVSEFLKQNVIVNITSGNILRLLPPLNITYEEIDEFLDKFRDILESI